MAIPKLKKSRHHSSDEILKLHHIIYLLRGMDYNIYDARSVINVIEDFNLDKTKFEYPYDSYKNFKQHVYAGEFDADINSLFMSKEHCKELDKAVKEGRLWITY